MLITKDNNSLKKNRIKYYENNSFKYYALFKSNGNEDVMNYCIKKLHKIIFKKLNKVNLFSEKNIIISINNSFIEIDYKMYKKKIKGGSTCSMILINKINNIIYECNLGDSLCIFFNESSLICNNNLHNFNDINEILRSIKAGGFIKSKKANGILNISRSFGNFSLKYNNEIEYDPIKGVISCIPNYKIIDMNYIDYCLITSSKFLNIKKIIFKNIKKDKNKYINKLYKNISNKNIYLLFINFKEYKEKLIKEI